MTPTNLLSSIVSLCSNLREIQKNVLITTLLLCNKNRNEDNVVLEKNNYNFFKNRIRILNKMRKIMEIKYINLHFSHRAKDFSHLNPGFQISDQEPYSPFVFVYFLFFVCIFIFTASLEEGHFSQWLLEPRDNKIAHKLWHVDLTRHLNLNYSNPSCKGTKR